VSPLRISSFGLLMPVLRGVQVKCVVAGVQRNIQLTRVCTAAGTTHMVSLRTLKKANHVIKAQKRKRRRDEQLSQHPNAGTGDVLDID